MLVAFTVVSIIRTAVFALSKSKPDQTLSLNTPSEMDAIVTSASSLGSTSFTTTFTAASGPLLVTTMVHVMTSPL